MSTFFIPTEPSYYGSDATEEDAARCAAVIVERCTEMYPDVEFALNLHGQPDPEMDPDLRGEIEQMINDRWSDWCAN